MTLRALARELREFPATLTFCLIWILVFAAMTYTELSEGGPVTLIRWVVTGFGGGQRFGDLSLQDLGHAQYWRLITCNFVHYSFVHLGLNVLAMYQIGTLIESWYGSHQLVFLSGLLGGGGNLIAALIRYENGSSRVIHSGGGSVIILGFMGLCAVVGMRSKSRLGRSLGFQMVLFLILTALLGILLWNHIDNWGHAGGALVGSVAGLAHTRFMNGVSKPSAWGAGVLTGLVIAACGAAQFRQDRREAPARLELRLMRRSSHLLSVARELAALSRRAQGRGDLATGVDRLRAIEQILDGRSPAAVHESRTLLEAAAGRLPSDTERLVLSQSLSRATSEVLREYQLDQRQLRQLHAPR
jgi:membrane associated rhomboid family serine protease